MLKGTEKLFPEGYEEFVEDMIEHAEADDLPVTIMLQDIKDFSIKDFEDFFFDFERDTGLELFGSMFMCDDCGRMHLTIEIDDPGKDENTLVQ